MKIKELLTESYNQLDDPEIYQDCLDNWTSHYGDEDKADGELGTYQYNVWDLHEHGGEVYRVIYANSHEEVKMNPDEIGGHWTVRLSNIDDYLYKNWKSYGQGKKDYYIAVATIGPNNISNEGVDVAGNPEEKEVQILRPNEATYELYEVVSGGYGRLEKIRENIGESVQSLTKLDDPEVYADCQSAWANYYGDEEKANDELENYKSAVDRLIKDGGEVYRVIFANSPEEINSDNFGNHWTTDQGNIEDYIENIWGYYGEGKKRAYLITAIVGPNNIDIKDVNVDGEPSEKEVNIIRPNEAKYKSELYREHFE